MEGKGTAAEVGVEGPNPLVLLLHPLPSLPLWVPRRGDRTVSSSGRQLHLAHLRVLAQAGPGDDRAGAHLRGVIHKGLLDEDER